MQLCFLFLILTGKDCIQLFPCFCCSTLVWLLVWLLHSCLWLIPLCWSHRILLCNHSWWWWCNIHKFSTLLFHVLLIHVIVKSWMPLSLSPHLVTHTITQVGFHIVVSMLVWKVKYYGLLTHTCLKWKLPYSLYKMLTFTCFDWKDNIFSQKDKTGIGFTLCCIRLLMFHAFS